MSEIYFNYSAMGDIVADLDSERGRFGEIRAQVDGIVSRLHGAFIAEAEAKFSEIHTALQPDFDRFDGILGVLPQVIDESAKYNDAVDRKTAQDIQQIMTATRI